MTAKTTPHMSAYGPARFGADAATTALQLGPLAPLVGSWQGTGFNAIWRPDNTQPPQNSQIRRFLELNLTNDSIQFEAIPGVVPNRGVANQPDINLFGLHYLQRVSDADKPPFSTAGQALHIEPGLFMSVPASMVNPDAAPGGPQVPASIVRLASIPHGVSLLMQGPAPSPTPKPGGPNIPPIFPIPELPAFQPAAGSLGLGIQPTDIPPPGGDGKEHIVPEVNVAADIVGSQSNGPYPSEFQGFINDPNSILRGAIANQTILGTITIELSTAAVTNSIGNIPFLGLPNATQAQNPVNPNAFVSSARATFWIEWVRIEGPHPGNRPPVLPGGGANPIQPFPGQPAFLQLQYSQLSILIFNGVLWPHINVGTLRLAAG
jgi:hypothetical protein